MDYFLNDKAFMQALDSNDSDTVANIIYQYYLISLSKPVDPYQPAIKKLQQMFDDLGIFQDIILTNRIPTPGSYIMPYAYYKENNFTVNLSNCTVFSDAFIACKGAIYIIDETTSLIGSYCFDKNYNSTFEFIGIPKTHFTFTIDFYPSHDIIKAGPKVDKEVLRDFLNCPRTQREIEIQDL